MPFLRLEGVYLYVHGEYKLILKYLTALSVTAPCYATGNRRLRAFVENAENHALVHEEQTGIVKFLREPATYGTANPVEIMETHISRIFLVGDRAFKMKRAVLLPYADFSTPALRYAACLKEVDLNRATAPGLYLGVCRITREADGTLALDGKGEMIDAVVEMMRFDQSALFDRMASAGELTPGLMTRTAAMIAGFHRQAPVAHVGTGAENMRGVLDINRAGFAQSHVFGETEVTALDAAFRAALSRHAATLDRREAEGKIRRCHGDLHLRNICLLDGEPCLFDCIEFNDAIATIDVLYDLAFLLMDLWHRGFPDLANLTMNRYLDEAGEEDGFVLLPFFMAVRAEVRAHVIATQAEKSGDADGKLAAEARAYFDLAKALLAECPARLIAIGGLSGSGKTTLAEIVAPHIGPPPGARFIESDRIRKALHGVSAETRLPAEAYLPAVSEKVYGDLARRAEQILAAGGTVIAAAVFDRAPDRARIEKAATEQGREFTGVWLDVSPDVLRQRVEQRRGGPSDATVDILARQLQKDIGDMAWHRIDAGRDRTAVADDIRRLQG